METDRLIPSKNIKQEPDCETARNKQSQSMLPSGDIKQEQDYKAVKTEENGERESDMSPFINRSRTRFTSLSYPDEDSFLYCEKCQLKYEGGCPDHGPLIYVDNAEDQTANGEEESDMSHVIKRARTSFTSLSCPDDGIFLYCEKCQQKYEGGCPDHGLLIYIDNAEADHGEDCSQDSSLQVQAADSKENKVGGREKLLQSQVSETHIDDVITLQNGDCCAGSDQMYSVAEMNIELCDPITSCGLQNNVEIKAYLKTHNTGKPFTCDVCETGFSYCNQLKMHKRTHTGEKPYRCDLCGAGFSVLGSLKTHMRTHTGEKPCKCDVCGAGFSVLGSLKKHMRTHTGEKPCKCDVCGAGFSMHSSLNRHKRTHTGERPYKCDVCGVGFSESGHLNRHKKTHTGERPYNCDVCGIGFSQNSNLNIHKRTHTGEKPYKCDMCGIGFAVIRSLNRHKKIHSLNRHKKTHTEAVQI